MAAQGGLIRRLLSSAAAGAPYAQCVKRRVQRPYSSATHKENQVELGDSNLAAPNFASSPKTRSRQVRLAPPRRPELAAGGRLRVVGGNRGLDRGND